MRVCIALFFLLLVSAKTFYGYFDFTVHAVSVILSAVEGSISLSIIECFVC